MLARLGRQMGEGPRCDNRPGAATVSRASAQRDIRDAPGAIYEKTLARFRKFLPLYCGGTTGLGKDRKVEPAADPLRTNGREAQHSEVRSSALPTSVPAD